MHKSRDVVKNLHALEHGFDICGSRTVFIQQLYLVVWCPIDKCLIARHLIRDHFMAETSLVALAWKTNVYSNNPRLWPPYILLAKFATRETKRY